MTDTSGKQQKITNRQRVTMDALDGFGIEGLTDLERRVSQLRLVINSLLSFQEGQRFTALLDEFAGDAQAQTRVCAVYLGI